MKKTAATAISLSVPAIPGCAYTRDIRVAVPVKTTQVNNALVTWYSQTGYTERNGKLLAKTLEDKGIRVASCDLRDFDKKEINQYDLIVIGSPVFYYDAPSYVQNWIKSLPHLQGTPVASYVTFGGPEGNQHNAACSILECLTERGGAPIALNTFMNMGTFPLSWSAEKVKESVWKNRLLPDEKTYKRVREYAGLIINQVKQGKTVEVSKKLTLREISTFFGPIWWTKRSISNHSIIEDKCISCGTCVEKCPVDAINLDNYTIDTDSCVLCFGCINSCPARAVNMIYEGRRLIGHNEFMKMHNLKIREPEELMG